MTLTLILILTGITICLILLKHKKAGIITLSITFLCFLALGYGVIASLLLKPLQLTFFNSPSPTWQQKNAIVLLGAGTIKVPVANEVIPTILSYSRIYTAARLYVDCAKQHSCILIVSGGDVTKTGRSEADVYREALINTGVNSSNIEIEPNSKNTYQNAQFTKALLQKEHFDQVILVTSGIHLKRAVLYFANVGVRTIPVPADYTAPLHAALPLAYNFAITDFAIHEYIGIARLYVYNFFGWNKGDHPNPTQSIN